ncbi:unnamed protein product [Closterium sp. NIES-64]|nr:unnamed protein product [Closterium sp. NIES-64]
MACWFGSSASRSSSNSSSSSSASASNIPSLSGLKAGSPSSLSSFSASSSASSLSGSTSPSAPFRIKPFPIPRVAACTRSAPVRTSCSTTSSSSLVTSSSAAAAASYADSPRCSSHSSSLAPCLRRRGQSRFRFVAALASAAVRSGVMDPSVRRDPELEGSAESSLPQPAPAGPRPRLPAHPSASEPVHHFERVQTLPHRPAARPASPEYSWAPARVASNRPDGQVAPLRAPTLREYQPTREGRAQFRTPRQVPGFSAPRLAVGWTPGWPAAFPREAQTAPLPTRAGRDPMLTMCRVLNLAEACEVVANLQLAVCGATRSFPSSFGPGTRGSCVTLAESLESPLAPVSDALAGVAPLARTFPRHVGDLVGAAQAGTPLDTLQSSAHLLLALSACMRSMLEVEGAEPYTM